MSGTWSEREIEAIVRDYFAMLKTEQEGHPINKSEHRRALMGTIDRSEGSIEWKHQNISAVLDLIGLPYIAGYLPGKNYQQALFEAVQAYLAEHRDLRDFLAGECVVAAHGLPPSNTGSSRTLDFEEPPTSPIRERAVPEEIRTLVRQFEAPEVRDARNRRLGRAGEELVFESERARLAAADRADLSDRVRWIARDDGDGFGYDIRSFAGQGERPEEERWLEVKTTTGSVTTPFFLTSNELRVSCRHPMLYRLVRLHSFQHRARAFRLRPPLDNHVRLSPVVYRACF